MRRPDAGVALLVLAMAAPPAHAAQRLLDPDRLGAAVDSIVQSAMSRGPIAGVSVAISRGGVPLFASAYGLADLQTKRPIRDTTLFPLCSISKHVAAAAVFTLIEAGRLHLDTRLDSVLTDVPESWRAITVRQLLSHTSGLGSYNDLPLWDSLCTRPLSHGEVLALVGSPPPAFPPGSRWRYSNTGYYLLGMIVEQLSGRDYWLYLRDAVVLPHMRSVVGVPLTERALGYRGDKEGLVPAERESWMNPFAGGGLAATASDLVGWDDQLRAGGLLHKSNVSLMTTPTKLGFGESIHYGLGTRLGSFEGHPVVGHTGNGNGFNHVLAHYPADGITIAVLTNSESSVGSRSIEAAIARRMLGLGPYREIDGAVPPGLATSIAGKWTDGLDQWTLFKSGEHLCFKLSNGDERALQYRGGNAFALAPDFEVRFVLPPKPRHGKSEPPAPVRVSETFRAGMFDEAQFRP